MDVTKVVLLEFDFALFGETLGKCLKYTLISLKNVHKTLFSTQILSFLSFVFALPEFFE